ncbi:glycosyl hydrolase family 65 central catalytic domain-containing protein [Lipomyces kononenkoae]|uniref:Glycosyl hydrolase family 65 central catalytic domain-containing protein n=1 Tax=Lipomyces kononenkoae TaxID=34357 RepID=A0ACC3T3L2_LIPKO
MRLSVLISGCVTLSQVAFAGSSGVSAKLRQQLSREAIRQDAILDGVEYDDRTWTLTSRVFTTNRFQVQPYVSNGYIGARLPVEGTGYVEDLAAEDGTDVGVNSTNGWPLFSPRFTGAYVAGFWDLQPNTTATNFPELLQRGGESVISTVPVWSTLLVSAHGDTFNVNCRGKNVHGYAQSLSLKDGVVRTELEWHPNGNESQAIWLAYEVSAHRAIPTLAMVKLDVVARQDTKITLSDILDGAGSLRTIFLEKNYSSSDGTGMWTGVRPYGLRNVRAYEYSHLEFSDTDAVNLTSRRPSGVANNKSPATISQEFDVSLEAGKMFTTYKFVGIASSDAYKDPKRVAAYTARIGATIGYRLAMADHRLEWHKLWESGDIVFPGDVELQISIRASLFHLLSAVRSGDEPPGRGDNSIAVSGLSSDSYGGMVFWDADTWMYPALSVLHPKYGSNINNFRQRIHGQAVENARSYNLNGAIYSWTSGRFGNCTASGPCVDYEYHINVDIAQAHWNQFLLSNDTVWLEHKGWPIIRDAAAMLASYVVKNASTGPYYYTYNMTDPDEYANFVDNGAFTNAGISKLMGWARRAAVIVGQDADPKWADVEQNIYIPVNPDGDLVLEFSNMNGSVEIKQADVVLLDYPLEYDDDTRGGSYEQSLNNLDFYAMAQSPDGPAMTWAIFAINSAKLSPVGCASYTYLLSASQPYLRAPFYQFSEQMDDDPTTNGGTRPAFPFLTGHGGFLQVLTHGFTGFRPREDVFYLDPSLPPQIQQGYTVKGMKWRDSIFDLTIGLDETVIRRRRTSSAAVVTVRIGGGQGVGDYAVAEGGKLVVPTRRPDLNGTLVAGNVAECPGAATISSNTTWSAGHFPIAAVDGSNSTSWQPSTRAPSALVVDLGQVKNVAGVSLNWGRTPPVVFSVGYSADATDNATDAATMAWPVLRQPVTISAAYDAAAALEVRLGVGNVTSVALAEPVRARWLMLVVEGSYDAGLRFGDVGATVAEFAVIGGDEM